MGDFFILCFSIFFYFSSMSMHCFCNKKFTFLKFKKTKILKLNLNYLLLRIIGTIVSFIKNI